MEKARRMGDVYMSMVEHSPDLVSLADFDGNVLYLNQSGLTLVGLASVEDACSLPARDFFTAQGMTHADEVVAALRDKGAWEGEGALRNFVTGESIPASMSSFVVTGDDGQPLIATIARDLRARRRHDEKTKQLVEAAAHLADEQRVLAEVSSRALHGDLDDLLIAATEAVLVLVGASCSSIVTAPRESGDLDVVAYSGPGPRPLTVAGGRGSQPGYAVETGRVVVCSDRDDEDRFESATTCALRSGVSVPIAGDSGPWGALTVQNTVPRTFTDQEITFLGTMSDVVSSAVRRAELERRLRHRSQHDPLTGLPNRARVHEHLGRALERAQLAGGVVAVLLVDFDNFKSINDHFGHDIGDIALVAVAERLNAAVTGRVPTGAAREINSVSRLGGDEFLVVCEGVVDVEGASGIARSIVSDLSVPVAVGGREVPLSASIGIALSENGIDVSQLVHRADVAMYRAKSSARGTYAVYDASDARQARHHLTMSTDLRAAIDNDELTHDYAPLLDTSTGAIDSFVTLPIWEHPALGTLPAEDFVTTAEKTGLIQALGSWVLRRACRDAAAWQAAGGSIGVRVGVVATQIRQVGFVDSVVDALTESGLRPDRLVISIPESALRPIDDAIIGITLRDLHSRGVRLHLDNSSGGHSSIRNLQHFTEFEFFQLDSSDVDATFREHSAVVLAAVVALIHAIGARVVAAGVDSEEHLAGIGSVGCDLAMGIFVGPPVAAGDVDAMVNERIAVS